MNESTRLCSHIAVFTETGLGWIHLAVGSLLSPDLGGGSLQREQEVQREALRQDKVRYLRNI